MSILQLILVAINGLSVIVKNPALGGGSSVRMDQASELLGFLGELIARGDEGHQELQEFSDIIKGMAAEGGEPSREEWATLRARSDAAHDTIQEAATAAEAEEAAEVAAQKIAVEIAALEAIPEDERTEEQQDRLGELTAPPEE
jgi:hypothetical protein